MRRAWIKDGRLFRRDNRIVIGDPPCCPCGEPGVNGACCLPNCSCSLVAGQAACVAQGGIYKGDGTTCTAQTCAPPAKPAECVTFGCPCWTATDEDTVVISWQVNVGGRFRSLNCGNPNPCSDIRYNDFNIAGSGTFTMGGACGLSGICRSAPTVFILASAPTLVWQTCANQVLSSASIDGGISSTAFGFSVTVGGQSAGNVFGPSIASCRSGFASFTFTGGAEPSCGGFTEWSGTARYTADVLYGSCPPASLLGDGSGTIILPAPPGGNCIGCGDSLTGGALL